MKFRSLFWSIPKKGLGNSKGNMSGAYKNITAIVIALTMMIPLNVMAADNSTEIVSDGEASVIEESVDNSINEVSIDSSKVENSENGDLKAELSSVTEARNGVLQVNCIYIDDTGNKHIIQGGAGFLIGSKEGTEYVITNNHIIAPEKEYRDAAFKSIGVSKDVEWDKIELKAQVVVESDVVLEATVVKSSPALDMVVLQLEQPIYTRTPLTILTSNGKNAEKPYDIPENVYTLGYPTGITYEEPVYYSNDKVSMTSGSIANMTMISNAIMIQHDAKIDDSNCGGPLINEHGLVIGMNELMTDGSNYYTLDCAEIVSILDGLGIQYSKMTTEEYLELKNPKPLPVIEIPAVEITSEEAAPKWIITITILLVIVVLLLIIFILFMFIKNRKKDNGEVKQPKKKKEKKEELVKPFFMPEINKENGNKNGGAAMETGTLPQAEVIEDATTVLGGKPLLQNNVASVDGGTLIRKKTGDNILLCKSVTTIGKDSLNADYCIRDNSAISRIHAALTVNNSDTYIEDKGSTNGTFLNGVRLNDGEQKLLNKGDIVRLANEEFEYRK